MFQSPSAAMRPAQKKTPGGRPPLAASSRTSTNKSGSKTSRINYNSMLKMGEGSSGFMMDVVDMSDAWCGLMMVDVGE